MKFVLYHCSSETLFFACPDADFLLLAGPLIRMIIEISWDMLPFLLVMCVLIVGFSGAFYILFTPSKDTAGHQEPPADFATYQSTLLSTFLMIIGSFDINTFKNDTPNSSMAIIMFSAYQVLGMIVLLNLLIAIMGDTFDRVKEMESLHFWKARCGPDSEHGQHLLQTASISFCS